MPHNARKADKGTTTVIMNRIDKFNEGQVQLDDIHTNPQTNLWLTPQPKKFID